MKDRYGRTAVVVLVIVVGAVGGVNYWLPASTPLDVRVTATAALIQGLTALAIVALTFSLLRDSARTTEAERVQADRAAEANDQARSALRVAQEQARLVTVPVLRLSVHNVGVAERGLGGQLEVANVSEYPALHIVIEVFGFRERGKESLGHLSLSILGGGERHAFDLILDNLLRGEPVLALKGTVSVYQRIRFEMRHVAMLGPITESGWDWIPGMDRPAWLDTFRIDSGIPRAEPIDVPGLGIG